MDNQLQEIQSSVNATALPKYRTVRQACMYLHSIDNESVVNEYFIRNLVREGKVQHIMSGRKIYLNLESLLNYLTLTDERPQE